MAPTAERPDPRPRLRAALDQAQRQVDAIGSADLSRPTPCAEYDVRTLLAHLVAVLRKLTVVGHGGDMAQVSDPADDLGDDWAEMFSRTRAEVHQVWAPDSTLDTSYALPWGSMTGSDLLDAYAHEFTAHAWDLSRVTGHGDDLDPILATAALDWYSRNVPAEDRPGGGPFAPPVAVAAGADAYTRLAGFLGRPGMLHSMTVRASGIRQQSIWASVVSDDAAALRSWLLALGFAEDLLIPGERDGAIHHCQLDWPEGGRILLSSTNERPTPCRPGTSSLHVVTADPDAVMARARAVNAAVVHELTDQTDYPSRDFTVTDPDGNHWTFATFAG